jgi:hypothetical protein
MRTTTAHWSDAYVAGLAGALVAVLAGAWLAAAPFIFAYQPEGADWVEATQTGVWTGVGLIAAGLLVGLLLAAGLRTEITATHVAPTEPFPPGYDDLDRAMAEVTAALLAEVGDHRAARPDTPQGHGVDVQPWEAPERRTR